MNPAARLRDYVIKLMSSGLYSLEDIKNQTDYQAALWSAMGALYQGGSLATFTNRFKATIQSYLTQAWNDGAREMNVAPDEMSPDDLGILAAILNNEFKFVQRLADDIQAAADAGYTVEDYTRAFWRRAVLWANRYKETANRARMTFGSKVRFMWTEGDTLQKCETCVALDGIVAYGWEWAAAGFHPQMPPNPLLQCDGWGCDCDLSPTDRRRTPRALDYLTNLATQGHV